MTKFITNAGAGDLKTRLVDLIGKSRELKFLVGFFYFSGIRELYEGLKSNPEARLKILVGLNVDRNNFGLIEFADEDDCSDAEKTYKFIESIRKSINTEIFDTQEFHEQVRFFIDLIKSDKLQIRKTYRPNHAKLYIFKLEESQVGRKNLFITGSSNLTRAGLATQNEFNVEIGDYGFTDAEKYFDDLWEDGVKITENPQSKKELIDVVEKDTLIKTITPFEAFCLVLKTYLDSYEEKDIGDSLVDLLRKNGYTPYQYQLDAVKQALAIIEKHNGVVIADVVGLGKTIIACVVARQLKKRGVIICPPGLVGDTNKTIGWRGYAEAFGLADWEVRSLGGLAEIAEFVRSHSDIEVIVIDEAHRFRNQDTEDYETLKNICRSKIVILLTATPFNNRPGDILSLLKLFVAPKMSSITLENNLADKFRAFQNAFDRLSYIKKYRNSPNKKKQDRALAHYKAFFAENVIDPVKVAQRSKYLARQIRDVIEPVTIRRNRLDLQNNPRYKEEVTHLSKLADPIEWYFELTKEQSSFYDEVITGYFGEPDNGGRFSGAIYRPFEYEVSKEKSAGDNLNEKDNRRYTQQQNLYDFMRRLLVKRFESSFGAFRKSIENFKRITETILTFIRKTGKGDYYKGKYILDRGLLEKITELELDEIEQYLSEYAEKISKGEYPKNHDIYEIPKFADAKGFIEAIQSDLKIFNELLERMAKLDLIKNDPKSQCLVKNLKKELGRAPRKGEPKRKIVIFSEYHDTVKYLSPLLAEKFGKRILDIAGDLPASKVKQIIRNFDASFKEQDNDYDILLASDKISEGFNLNRAGMVVNYDIPWNPVRVIQRVGRINRISRKVFDDIYIVNFFPTERGAELVKSREIAANKMFLIHNTLGEDAKIFDVDEEPRASELFSRLSANPDKQESESFYTRVLKEYLKISKEHPEIVDALKNYPPRVKVAKRYDRNELLVFLKKGRLYVYSAVAGDNSETKISPVSFEDVYDKIACSPDAKPLDLSGGFWAAYEKVKDYKEGRLAPPGELSLEQKAVNNLKTFIDKVDSALIMPHKNFLRTLRRDIQDYGTLSDFTLRRISNLRNEDEKKLKAAADEIAALKKEMGEDYLEKESARRKDISKEVIIAIENRKE